VFHHATYKDVSMALNVNCLIVSAPHCIYTNTLYITDIVVFLTAFSICVSLLSSKIHNGDDTPKDSGYHILVMCQCKEV